MERWRHLLVRDFNFAHDETVQRFSSRILSNDIVTSSFDKEIQEQFPGIVGLMPMIFHIADQILIKVRELLPKTGLRLSCMSRLVFEAFEQIELCILTPRKPCGYA